MRATQVRRLICVSVLGAHESMAGLPFHLKYLLFPTYLRRPLREHEAQERIVRASGLDFTIVRPPFLTDGPATGRYTHGFVSGQEGLTLDISRADVADFMLRELEAKAYVGEAAGISYAA